MLVVTSATTTRMPDLAWTGSSLPAGTQYYASVQAIGPCPSVDAAAASTDVIGSLPSYWQAPFGNRIPASDGFTNLSVRGFTTP